MTKRTAALPSMYPIAGFSRARDQDDIGLKGNTIGRADMDMDRCIAETSLCQVSMTPTARPVGVRRAVSIASAGYWKAAQTLLEFPPMHKGASLNLQALKEEPAEHLRLRDRKDR